MGAYISIKFAVIQIGIDNLSTFVLVLMVGSIKHYLSTWQPGLLREPLHGFRHPVEAR